MWKISHPLDTGFETGVRTSGAVDWTSGVLVLALGIMLTSLAWLAMRQVRRIGRAAQARIALQTLMADQASEAMMLTDRAQRILSVNAAFETITGYSATDVLGNTPTRLSAGHHGLAGHRNVWDFVAEHGYWEGELWDRRKDGQEYQRKDITHPQLAICSARSGFLRIQSATCWQSRLRDSPYSPDHFGTSHFAV